MKSSPIHWTRTNDAELPYEASFAGARLRLRINDFPAEPYATVMEGDRELFHIEGWTDGWPSAWTRDPA
jgi:hypothetical protein